VLKPGASRFEQCADVPHHLLGLRGDAAIDKRAAGGIEWDLAR
jgi:hypothetical protein